MTDKEKLSKVRAEIEKAYNEAQNRVKLVKDEYCEGKVDAYRNVLCISDSIQEECNITGIKSRHATGKLKECIDLVKKDKFFSSNEGEYLEEETNYCAFSTSRYTDEDRKVLCDGCEEGCEYAQKKEPVSIWHDANIELPRKDKEVLALVIRPNLRAYVAFPSGHGTLYSLFGTIDINDVSKWCYIDDILNLSNVERTVKDWKEMPVSEDLEEAAKHYLYSNILYDDVYVGNPTDKDCIEMFKAGAKWQKARNQEIIETAIHHAYHNGRLEMKEQMMAKAIDATIGSFTNGTIYDADFNIDSNLKDDDKVKVIVIKED